MVGINLNKWLFCQDQYIISPRITFSTGLKSWRIHTHTNFRGQRYIAFGHSLNFFRTLAYYRVMPHTHKASVNSNSWFYLFCYILIGSNACHYKKKYATCPLYPSLAFSNYFLKTTCSNQKLKHLIVLPSVFQVIHCSTIFHNNKTV